MRTASSNLVELGLSSFAERVADRSPTPGGGSVAALTGALGAALLSMAFRVRPGESGSPDSPFVPGESGSPDSPFVPGEPQGSPFMEGRAEELDELRAELLARVERDARAYGEVARALTAGHAEHGEPPEDAAARAEALQTALREALAVPFEVMELALAGLRLGAAGAPDVDRRLASDLETGALALWAALEGAHATVRANAGELEDRALADERLAVARALSGEATALLAELRADGGAP